MKLAPATPVASLDGYVEDQEGSFDWSAPDDEVHAFVNELEREFDRDAVRRLKRSSEDDITIGGAEIAVQAFDAGLVAECHLFLCPVVVGGGKRALPAGVPAQLELLDERRFGNGVVHVHYRVTGRANDVRRSLSRRSTRR